MRVARAFVAVGIRFQLCRFCNEVSIGTDFLIRRPIDFFSPFFFSFIFFFLFSFFFFFHRSNKAPLERAQPLPANLGRIAWRVKFDDRAASTRFHPAHERTRLHFYRFKIILKRSCPDTCPLFVSSVKKLLVGTFFQRQTVERKRKKYIYIYIYIKSTVA